MWYADGAEPLLDVAMRVEAEEQGTPSEGVVSALLRLQLNDDDSFDLQTVDMTQNLGHNRNRYTQDFEATDEYNNHHNLFLDTQPHNLYGIHSHTIYMGYTATQSI